MNSPFPMLGVMAAARPAGAYFSASWIATSCFTHAPLDRDRHENLGAGRDVAPNVDRFAEVDVGVSLIARRQMMPCFEFFEELPRRADPAGSCVLKPLTDTFPCISLGCNIL